MSPYKIVSISIISFQPLKKIGMSPNKKILLKLKKLIYQILACSLKKGLKFSKPIHFIYQKIELISSYNEYKTKFFF